MKASDAGTETLNLGTGPMLIDQETSSITAGTKRAARIPRNRTHSDWSRPSETAAELAGLLELETDWNDEGAEPIDAAAVALARKIFERAFIYAGGGELSFREPTVFPTNLGGAQLCWFTPERQAILTFPSGGDLIELREKRRGEPATSRVLSEDEAVSLIVEESRTGA
jgi:hypothetical protein